jgi:hypothetical protein
VLSVFGTAAGTYPDDLDWNAGPACQQFGMSIEKLEHAGAYRSKPRNAQFQGCVHQPSVLSESVVQWLVTVSQPAFLLVEFAVLDQATGRPERPRQFSLFLS